MDPVRDLDIINEELRLKDEEFFMKVFEDVERKCVRGSEKKLKPEYVRINFFKEVCLLSQSCCFCRRFCARSRRFWWTRSATFVSGSGTETT